MQSRPCCKPHADPASIPHDAVIILLMFRHRLCTDELIALRWQQVDLKAGCLDFHRVKRGHNAKHPLRGPQLRLLWELQRTYPNSL
jgi:integrase